MFVSFVGHFLEFFATLSSNRANEQQPQQQKQQTSPSSAHCRLPTRTVVRTRVGLHMKLAEGGFTQESSLESQH